MGHRIRSWSRKGTWMEDWWNQVKSYSLSYCCVNSVSFDNCLRFLWKVSLGGGDAGVWYVIVRFLCSCSQRVKLSQDTKLKIHTCITNNPEKKNILGILDSHLAHLSGPGNTCHCLSGIQTTEGFI